MFDRNDPFSMKITDIDTSADEAVVRMLNIDGELIIFKTRSIFKILTADTLDPNLDHPETRHSYEKIYSFGSSSKYVARLIIQFNDLANATISDTVEKELLISKIWTLNKMLLDCTTSKEEISSHTTPLLKKADEIINSHKEMGHIPPLPKVPLLENHVRSFLNIAKLYLIETFSLLNLFFGLPLTDRNASRFSTHIDWIEEKLGVEHSISKLLKQDSYWIRLLSESRNALEHPEPGQTLNINNIKLRQGNKFSPPTWSYDLTKKLKTTSSEVDLISDLETYTHNMFSFLEELLILIFLEISRENKLIIIYRIEKNDTDSSCPVLYRTTINSDYLHQKI